MEDIKGCQLQPVPHCNNREMDQDLVLEIVVEVTLWWRLILPLLDRMATWLGKLREILD